MNYIGIDPGKKGGVAIISDEEVAVYPYGDDSYLEAMAAISGLPAIACVEHVGAMPKQGVVSTFTFGKGAGFLEGVLRAHRIPYQLVRPQRWKKEFGLTGDKAHAVEVCRRLFPEVNLLATPRCKVPHDGMAEAVLMAEYARRRL